VDELDVRQETSAFNMFPSDPLKNVGYRIIYTSVVIHGLGLAGLIGGSPIRHIAGIVGALIWSLWMIYGSSKFPWIMNILGTAVGAIAFTIGGKWGQVSPFHTNVVS
jgi:hypothetical protein